MAAQERETDPTAAYYSAHAAEYAARTNAIGMSPLYARFEPLLSPGSTILDLGCGGGRDARHFAGLGHQVIAMDPCPELLAEAERSTPSELRHRIRYMVGSAPSLPLPDSSCSAIWACASLLHLPRHAMPSALVECSRILRQSGVFSVSVKQGSGEGLDGERWFTYWDMSDLTSLIEGADFTILHAESIPSVDGRDSTWLHVVARSCHLR